MSSPSTSCHRETCSTGTSVRRATSTAATVPSRHMSPLTLTVGVQQQNIVENTWFDLICPSFSFDSSASGRAHSQHSQSAVCRPQSRRPLCDTRLQASCRRQVAQEQRHPRQCEVSVQCCFVVVVKLVYSFCCRCDNCTPVHRFWLSGGCAEAMSESCKLIAFWFTILLECNTVSTQLLVIIHW